MNRDNISGLKRSSWILPRDLMAKCVKYTINFHAETLEQERDKRILEYMFLDGYTAKYIHDLQDPCIVCYSNRNKGKPLSASSILSIVYQHIPELKSRERVYTPKAEPVRNELARQKQRNAIKKAKRCAFCGENNRLELHHMIPICMGGDNSDENLVYLCHDCHKKVTEYQRTICR